MRESGDGYVTSIWSSSMNVEWSRRIPVPAPKVLLHKQRGSSRPQELSKYGYECQAKLEGQSRGSNLNLNPRTNKQETDVVANDCHFLSSSH